MSVSSTTHTRPITRADIEAKLGQIRDAAQSGTEQAKGASRMVGVAVVVVVVVGAYLVGRRRGRKRRTIVEVRRV
jgi:UDP-N-acetylmuramyl pentapeptide phosphotransferase/UDP-N-acetylglucosamine-1-phosphate transferase